VVYSRRAALARLAEPRGAVHPEGAAAEALARAVAAVAEPDVFHPLQAVADEMPPALSLDFVNIRLAGDDGNLHLVAASGCSASEVRKRAFQPLPIARVRESVESGRHERTAMSLGIHWIEVAWMRWADDDVGAIAAGARTKRRPSETELRVLHTTVETLAERLSAADRRAATLRTCSVRLARSWTPYDLPAEGPIERLRPRERAILELYADGLSTADIATLLVISPHTVRTHVKLAMRRLGVHERGEAVTMVRADQVAQIL
jgi:DNA-binding CsgD family transcriptional regulator